MYRYRYNPEGRAAGEEGRCEEHDYRRYMRSCTATSGVFAAGFP